MTIMGRFKSLTLSLEQNVARLELCRPSSSNAISKDMWQELPLAVEAAVAQGARVIVLSGSGKNFCAGIDLPSLTAELAEGEDSAAAAAAAACAGRLRYHFRRFVFVLQQAMSAFEACPVPVIAAVHGHCIGAGVDLVTACDVRLATAAANFCVKEVDLGIVADMGTLQRLPSIVGHGMAADLALTARNFSGAEAERMHLVSRTFVDQRGLMEGAMGMARLIAAKSPLAVAGTKRVLLQQRDNPSVAAGLDYVATWNAAMLPQSADVRETFLARAEGRRPAYSKL